MSRSSESTRLGEALRAAVAGGHAAKLIGSATAIFQAGGNRLLSESARSTLRIAVEKSAEKAIATATGALLLPSELSPMKLIGSGARATSAVVKGGARVAAREIAKGAGRAAGIGFVVDGAVASVEPGGRIVGKGSRDAPAEKIRSSWTQPTFGFRHRFPYALSKQAYDRV
jgi:hypothetical protein